MDWSSLVTQVLAAAILAAVGWVIRSLRDLADRQSEHASAMDARMDKVEQDMVKVQELERHDVLKRLGDLEVQAAASVTRDQVARIHARVDEVHRDNLSLVKEIGEIAGTVKAVRGATQAIQDHLLAKGNSK